MNQRYLTIVSGFKGIEIAVADSNQSSKNKADNETIIVKPATSHWVIVDLKIPDGTSRNRLSQN